MRQILHLLIVDRERDRAAATMHGARWLLPVLISDERTRVAPLVAHWCAERGVAGDVAGQWLGRVSPRAADWLIAIVAGPQSTAAPAFQWQRLDALDPAAALLEYQGWAIARALEGSTLKVSGPFGNLSWPQGARAWIETVVGAPVRSLTPYRVSASGVVIGVECGCERVYLKGLTAARGGEARLTQALATIDTDSFARTLAVRDCGDGSVWWLTAACPGRPATNASDVASALARMQRLVEANREIALHRLDLDAVAEWAAQTLVDSSCVGVVSRRVHEVTRADVPLAWTPMDLDRSNILVDGYGQVRFIDLDDSFLAPAPLALAGLAMRTGDRRAYELYERSWSALSTRLDWVAFETVAAVVQSWLGWHRLRAHVACGEVVVDPTFAAERIRCRLIRALDDISRCRARRGGPGA